MAEIVPFSSKGAKRDSSTSSDMMDRRPTCAELDELFNRSLVLLSAGRACEESVEKLLDHLDHLENIEAILVHVEGDNTRFLLQRYAQNQRKMMGFVIERLSRDAQAVKDLLSRIRAL